VKPAAPAARPRFPETAPRGSNPAGMSAAPESDLPPVCQLFERYGPMVYRRCRDILGREDAARDAVQDVFMRAMEKRHLFRGEASPSTWLYSMATLHCLQGLRDRRLHGAKLEKLAAATRGHVLPSTDAQLSVARLLDQQPEETRLIVYLRFVDDLTMDEVAELVGYSRKTVGQRIQQFLSWAREQLEETEGTP
jgi:RNA polymerase sigma-70 factor, ECF subfamily